MHARAVAIAIQAVVLILLLALLGAGAAPAPTLGAPPAPAPVSGAVHGRVVAVVDGSPVAGANVVVLGTRRGAVADSAGAFRVDGIPPGDYTLRVQMIGATAESRSIHVTPGHNDLGVIKLAAKIISETIYCPIGRGPADLVASIRPTRNRLVVGDAPAFDVRIRNRGDDATVLVRSVDASDRWASPRVQITIDGPEGGFVVPELLYCGNINGVRGEDFVAVAPGGSFDPYGNGWYGTNLTRGRFAKPGEYTATFHYSTVDRDPRTWGDGGDLPAGIRGLLDEVPPVDLTARVTFRVDP